MIYDGIEADDVMAYIATTLRQENEKVVSVFTQVRWCNKTLEKLWTSMVS